jgi:putative endonuclease
MAFKLSNKLGIWGERLAEAKYLERGYVFVTRNAYNSRGKRLGEIDLVVRSETHLVFVEVKTRRSQRFGTAVESITAAKQRRIVKAVSWFCRLFPQFKQLQIRIDVCAIDIITASPNGRKLDKPRVNVTIIPSAVTLDY